MHHVSTPSSPCLCTALRKASRAVSRAYDEALDPAGMTTVQFAILRHIARGGSVPLSRLAEQLVLERTSLYRTIEPLERRGWVAIVAGRGRERVASLSREGVAALEAAEPHWEAVQARMGEAFGADKWVALQTLLGEATEAMR